MLPDVKPVLERSKKLVEDAADFPKMPQVSKPIPVKNEFAGVPYKLAKPKRVKHA